MNIALEKGWRNVAPAPASSFDLLKLFVVLPASLCFSRAFLAVSSRQGCAWRHNTGIILDIILGANASGALEGALNASKPIKSVSMSFC
jgi:hypothetical protein